MHKYIKRIIGLFLFIVITGSNCNDKETKSTNSTVKVTLDQLAAKLQDGPIFIGENHGKPYARQAIEALINKGCVKKLFLELPDPAPSVTGPESNDKLIPDKAIAIYLSNPDRVYNKLDETIALAYVSPGLTHQNTDFPLKKLLEAALAKKSPGIAIYYHDAPKTPRGKLISLNNTAITQSDLNQAIKERNQYSSTIIAPYINATGVVILAGQRHLDPVQVEGGKPSTLQGLLNVNDDRVFDLSEKEVQ